MANPNDNGKNGQTPSAPPSLGPEDILHQVSVVITKDGPAVIGDLDNLPLLLYLLAQGVDIVGGLVSQKLPQRIHVVGSLPSGTLPFGRAEK